MEVILLERVSKLGHMGEVVKVWMVTSQQMHPKP